MYFKIIRIKVGHVMKFQKKHIISAALVLALGAAVYVNWQFGSSAAKAKPDRALSPAVGAHRDAPLRCDRKIPVLS